MLKRATEAVLEPSGRTPSQSHFRANLERSSGDHGGLVKPLGGVLGSLGNVLGPPDGLLERLGAHLKAS